MMGFMLGAANVIDLVRRSNTPLSPRRHALRIAGIVLLIAACTAIAPAAVFAILWLPGAVVWVLSPIFLLLSALTGK
jgi:hypothetical protein